jgi:hypothetical protein
MERYKDEIMYEVAKETLRYAANKIAMEYQMDGKPLPAADELVRLAVARVKAGAVNKEVI